MENLSYHLGWLQINLQRHHRVNLPKLHNPLDFLRRFECLSQLLSLVSRRGRQHRFGKALSDSHLHSREGDFILQLGSLLLLVRQTLVLSVARSDLRQRRPSSKVRCSSSRTCAALLQVSARTRVGMFLRLKSQQRQRRYRESVSGRKADASPH
jgi:hypothetical protein